MKTKTEIKEAARDYYRKNKKAEELEIHAQESEDSCVAYELAKMEASKAFRKLSYLRMFY